MGLAGFLRKFQDIYTQHKVISTIFFSLFIIPPTYFYTFYATGHLSTLFLSNHEDADNLIATTFHYVRVVAQVEGFAILGLSLFFLLTPLLEILASHKIDPRADLSFKSLALIVTKPARSLFVTWFIVRLLKLGYIFLGILFVFRQEVIFINSSSHEQPKICALPGSGTIIFVSGGVLFFAYFGIFGNLALEISLREGISGTEALGKASQLLEGKRKLVGFVVNLVLGVVSVGLFVVYEYLNTCSNSKPEKSIMLNIWHGICQVEFYTWISFSILYFKCKKARGETTFQPQGSFKRILLEELPLVATSAQNESI